MTHWEAALSALEAGQWTDAKRHALAHLGDTPRSGEGFLALATAMIHLGDLDRALLALGQALSLEATAAGYFLLGVVLEQLGQPVHAEKAHALALRLNPEHPSAMSRRLACRGQQPEHPLAEAEAAAIERLFSFARPTVSACLIVKNEARNLAGCLSSLNGWVDEIVVVDTGSTDDTVAIAESFGAKLGHFTWCDDFSAARNASLELATSEWVLIIDADEQLQVEDAERWQQALRRREPGGYVLHQRNLKDDGSIENDAPVMRLFQRHEAIRFEGRLHEVVGPSIAALGWPSAELPGVRLVHTGYQSAAMAAHAKGERNLAIARQAALEQPDDAFTLLQLARSYCFNHQPAESLPHFERLRALPGLAELPLPMWANFVTNLQGVYQAVGRPEAAEALLSEALEHLPDYPEFRFERGLVRFRLGRYDEAGQDFERCLAVDGQDFGLPMRPGLTGPLPRQALIELAPLRQRAPRPTVSACLIVKNEAAKLGRCLSSLNGWVDEIVVVDTGSTDDTVAIAESFGAKLGHFAWCDDFSAARNTSLELATSEWILVIDADEQLQIEDAEAFRRALTAARQGGYFLAQRNLQDDGNVTDTPMMRLFRRDARIRYEKRLHEEATASVERAGFGIGLLDAVVLRHDGYLRADAAAMGKGERNLRIALAEAEASPNSPNAWFDVARSALYHLDGPDEAMAAFRQAARLIEAGMPMDEIPYCNFVGLFARVLRAQGLDGEALPILTQALERVPGCPEFLYERGRLRMRRQDAAGARADFEACLAAKGRQFPIPVRPGLTDVLPERLLSELQRPTVSACLIVKNEVRNLAGCLSSLSGWVDEIVVVDTGSTDDTVAIAESFGAKLGHFAWCDDFSAARNASLELATSEWVLIIDADEQLEIADAEHWRMVLTGPCDAVILTQANVDAAGRVETETQALRLFKRRPAYRFSGRLHESVLEAVQGAGASIGEAAFLRLRHTGYQADQVDAEGKGARNVRLAELAVAERPDDARAWFDLARSHGLNRDPRSALAAFERLAALPGGLEALDDRVWPYAVQTLQNTYRVLGRPADAEGVLDRAVDRLPGFPEFHWERAQLRLERGDKAGAIADLQACRAAHGNSFSMLVRPGLTDALPDRLLAELQRPTVSACLIVKNESARLGRCLSSLNGWVDEIVVVDTGSTDETVAIAESFGAKVGHFVWCDDFSAARNASLELATSDWVLVIDADEQLQVEDAGHWRRALSAGGAYHLEIRNVEIDGLVTSRTQSFPRLFQRRPGVRFVGRLHETPNAGIAAHGWQPAALEGAWLRHEGYSDVAIATGDKLARNRHLAERMIADDPGNPEAWHFLASTCWLGKDPDGTLAAIAELRARLASGRRLPLNFHRTALLVEAWAAAAIGRPQQALAALEEGLVLVPGFAEYRFERGRLRAVAGEVDAAIADFEACLASPRGASERDGVTGYLSHAELVELHVRRGEVERAARHLRLAAADPVCPLVEAERMRALADRLVPPSTPAVAAPSLEDALSALEADRPDDAKAAALAYLRQEPHSADAFLILASAMARLGVLDKSLLAVGQALGLQASAPGYALLGGLLDTLDQPALAERAYATAVRLNPDHPTAQAARVACRGRRPAHPLPEAEAIAIERLFVLATAP